MIMINPAVQIVRLDLKIIMVFDELNMFKMYYTLHLHSGDPLQSRYEARVDLGGPETV